MGIEEMPHPAEDEHGGEWGEVDAAGNPKGKWQRPFERQCKGQSGMQSGHGDSEQVMYSCHNRGRVPDCREEGMLAKSGNIFVMRIHLAASSAGGI